MKRYHPFIRAALASLVATTFGTLFAGVRTYQTFGPNATVLSGAIGLFRSDIGGGNKLVLVGICF